MKNNIVQRCDFRMHDMIDGKFRVERVLGFSQTDQKFKVNDTSGKEYILKLLKLWDVESRLRQSMLHSAENEIKSCRIKSNYLTTITHSGRVNGNPYLLMEYCSSEELSHLMSNPRLNTIKVVKEILYGLRDLHKSGKVHGQLTPEDVLITEGDHAVITNYVTFGRRGAIDNSSRQMRTVDSTKAYRAPELYRIEKCSTILPTVDIFSFGVILYQLLTGELPFGPLNTDSDWVLYQTRARNNEWNSNLLLRDENSEMWLSILNACLQADASKRARNIDELLDKMPANCYPYKGARDSQVEAPIVIQNGLVLHVMQGDDCGKYYRLPEIAQSPRRIITIGRADNSVFNMIQLSELASTYISRRHCTLELDCERDIWYIRDGQGCKESKEIWTRSLNGTFVNSDMVSQEGLEIRPGDIISIGGVKLRVEAY